MARAEQDGLAYLFSPADDGKRQTGADRGDGRTRLDGMRGMAGRARTTTLRLVGWSRQRRIVLLRRKLDRPLVIIERDPAGAAAAELCRGRV